MRTESYVLVYVDDVAFSTRTFSTLQALGQFAAKRGLTRYDYSVIQGEVLRDIVKGPGPRCQISETQDECAEYVRIIDPDTLRNLIESQQVSC